MSGRWREMDWAAAFFRDADTLDIHQMAPWFADTVELRFGNAPPIHGKAEAVAALSGFWSTISGMRHEREVLLSEGDSVVQMARVTYTDPTGRKVTLPAASHLRRTGERQIDRLWIYIDMAPLYAAA